MSKAVIFIVDISLFVDNVVINLCHLAVKSFAFSSMIIPAPGRWSNVAHTQTSYSLSDISSDSSAGGSPTLLIKSLSSLNNDDKVGFVLVFKIFHFSVAFNRTSWSLARMKSSNPFHSLFTSLRPHCLLVQLRVSSVLTSN